MNKSDSFFFCSVPSVNKFGSDYDARRFTNFSSVPNSYMSLLCYLTVSTMYLISHKLFGEIGDSNFSVTIVYLVLGLIGGDEVT